jgi:hypothetical protein
LTQPWQVACPHEHVLCKPLIGLAAAIQIAQEVNRMCAEANRKLLFALPILLLLIAGCDSGQPSGEALQSPVPATRAPTEPRVFPTGVAVPTLTAISALAARSTPVNVNDEIPSADFDACTLLTEEEAEAATGLELTRADITDQVTPGARCRYEAEGTSISLKVFEALDEAQAARFWRGQYDLYLHAQVGSYSQYVPGIGDAAFIYIPRGSGEEFMSQRFWYLVAKRGTMYFELLWMTESTDPTTGLSEMARKIVTRLEPATLR